LPQEASQKGVLVGLYIIKKANGRRPEDCIVGIDQFIIRMHTHFMEIKDPLPFSLYALNTAKKGSIYLPLPYSETTSPLIILLPILITHLATRLSSSILPSLLKARI
jgi:hypothetical protein